MSQSRHDAQPTAPQPAAPTPSGGTNGGKLLGAGVSRVIALAITLVWVVSCVADVVSAEYAPTPYIHAAMLGLGATAFGAGFVRGPR